ncbi:hypothetical protein PTTG_26444 [Puccinia triticina 1-1 BBBD Race 1]|uniref:Golgi apparatus membrane protein TVP38 n=1 Tax=Puccinia triticina (isolate 1-1 / race 1 (BBBD)) TaxID=630390 RepID=A0A180GUF8_PUCT1|nr:hypothetical protein PTTG_26444 [Puccinia triticina 1-1 BBBD Race 1]
MKTPSSRRPLQLLNPQAAAHVALTPAPPAPRLSSSQHTLQTLAGGRYYDEYDEDDDGLPPPHSAHFPPSPDRARPPTAGSSHLITFQSPKPASCQSSSANHPPPSTPLPPPPPPPLLLERTPAGRLARWNRPLRQKPLLGFCIRLLLLVLLCAAAVALLVWTLLPPRTRKTCPRSGSPPASRPSRNSMRSSQIYKTAHYYRVLSSFVLLYLFLQTFSLPGSMYLSILAGAMFGVQVALPLVCMCVGTGAMLCYLMSLCLARDLVVQTPSIRARLEDWKLALATKTNKLDLFAYLVVIRISPLPPHWVVNLLAPHVGIRLGTFWLSTCLGILPVTLIHTQLGTTLDQMVGPEELAFLTPKNLSGLALVAAAVLVPVLIRWRLRTASPLPHTSTAQVSSVQSTPFAARIGLPLNHHNHTNDDDDEDEDDDDDDEDDDDELEDGHGRSQEQPPGPRRQTVRSLSGQPHLHKLTRVDSPDTLLLSSTATQQPSAAEPPTHRPVLRPLAIPHPPGSSVPSATPPRVHPNLLRPLPQNPTRPSPDTPPSHPRHILRSHILLNRPPAEPPIPAPRPLRPPSSPRTH